MIGESDNKRPLEIPKTRLNPKPASAPSDVVAIESASVAASDAIAASTADGGGTRNFGTASARTASSHAMTSATNVTSGGTSSLASRALSGSMFLQRFVKDRRLAHEAHVGPDLRAARFGKLDRAIEHDAAGPPG